MKTVSIIRDRGQLTIPGSIRKHINWITPLSAVVITVVKPDEIVIKPHQSQIDWSILLDKIATSRKLSGKGHESALETLERDRHSH